MSRKFLTHVRANFIPPTTREEQHRIDDALSEEWNLSPEWTRWRRPSTNDFERETLFAHGENVLGGGETEEDASRKIREAIWGALDRFVNVHVGWIYIESPSEWHIGTEDECEGFLNTVARCDRCEKVISDWRADFCPECEDAEG